MAKTSCINCMDYDIEKEVCLIRYVYDIYGIRSPMSRKPYKRACKVYLRRTN